MRSYKYLTEKVKEIDINGELNLLWESVYKERLAKHGDKRKAITSANAVVYSKCLDYFINKD